MQSDVKFFSHQHPALYGKKGDEMFGLLEPGSTVPHSQHLILYCDTNTEFVIYVDTYSTKHKTSLLGVLCSELFFSSSNFEA